MNYKIAQPLHIYELGQRQRQEDSIYPAATTATENSRFFIICDGMGGHQAGDVASQCVSETMGHYLDCEDMSKASEATINMAVSAAYDKLDACDNDSGRSGRKMGTTLVMMVLNCEGAIFAHIGDSRIYHIRPSQGAILYKSKDHSLVYTLYELGEITLEEMRTHPRKNIITKAIQPNQEQRKEATIVTTTDVCVGDYFYLCSDGMLETITDEQIVDIFSREGISDEEKVEALKDESADNKDNHTAYIIKITDVQMPSNISDNSTAAEEVAEVATELPEVPESPVDDTDDDTDVPVIEPEDEDIPTSPLEEEEEEAVAHIEADNFDETTSPKTSAIFTRVIYIILSIIILILITVIILNLYL